MTDTPTPTAEKLLANLLAMDVYHRDSGGGLIEFLKPLEQHIDDANPSSADEVDLRVQSRHLLDRIDVEPLRV